MAPRPISHPPSAGESASDAFGRDASKALSRLKLALAAVVKALPQQAGSAAELAKLLGLNRKIAWQVWRIVSAPSAGGGAPVQALPGPGALEGFLAACGREGVPRNMLDAVREASRRFDDLAVLHAGEGAEGGRATLMSLLRQSGAGGPDTAAAERAAEAVRRQAFSANSEIWGVQTQVYFGAAILAPGSDPDRVDDLSIAGEIGVRRLRADAVRVVAGLGFRGGPRGGADASAAPQPRALVDVEPGSGLIEPMVPRFTSARVRAEAAAGESSPGQTRVELVESPVGRRGEVDFVLAQFCPGVGRRWATAALKRVHFTAHLFSPYAQVVQDLIVRRDLWDEVRADAKIYSALRGMMTSQSRRDERDVLPIRAEVKRLGSGLSAMELSGVPRYAEIIDWACGRVGWNAEQFEVYRCVVMYPPMPASLVVGVELGEVAG